MCKGFHCSKKAKYIHYLYYSRILNLRGPHKAVRGNTLILILLIRKSETQRSHQIFPLSHSIGRQGTDFNSSPLFSKLLHPELELWGWGFRQRKGIKHKNQLLEN